jgi:hypothetical protein
MRPVRPLALAAACAAAALLSACAGTAEPVAAPGSTAPTGGPAPSPSSAAPSGTAPETTAPAQGGGKGGARSDLSQLKKIGIDIDGGVLIDVADDGVDRYLAVGRNSVVDFTGTGRTDNTMMALKAAPVSARNRVLIKPPFYNEEPGDGYCVADTPQAPLKLETCRTGEAAQVWRVVPEGDSGQFSLHGRYGVIRVDDGRITTGDSGRIGLQTIPFAR